jgi:hypothetical protein
MKLAALILFASVAVPSVPAHLQSHLGQYLGFSSTDIEASIHEPSVIEVEKEAGPRELSVAGVVRIDAPVDRVAARLRRDRGIQDRADLQQSGTFGDPAVGSDVASYELPQGDLMVLSECQPRSCKFKLSESGIREFGAIDWSAGDSGQRANSIARRQMVEYVNAYRENGWGSLAVFADKEQPMSVADGLKDLSAKAKVIDRQIPELAGSAEASPYVAPPGSIDVIHWSVKDYGYRPVTDVIHTIVYEPPDAGPEDPAVVVVDKRILSSHYFQARLVYIGLFPDERPGSKGTYLVYIDRSRFDGDITGIKRSLLVRGVLRDTRDQLTALQGRFASSN